MAAAAAPAVAVAVRRQIDEIKTSPDRFLAYASLLQLQRSFADNPTAMEALSLCSPPLIPLLISDARHKDEEIAAQALKCLGFMLYHPSLVPAISAEDAKFTLESLAELIMVTQMKSVCNLGMWCISIQQFGAGYLQDHVHSLLRAIVHALDNPFGSLSTTFEGIQALMKLAIQLCDMMREMSNIWLPPIYRRLISTDKKERDMAERCLLRTKSIIFPPPLTLSEIVRKDLQQRLFPQMMESLHDQSMKIHLIKAWGMYIWLLGSNELSNRHMVNKLLKIPEQTFTDRDPQIQIASLVAWQSLIDALLPQQLIHDEIKKVHVAGLQQADPSTSVTCMKQCDEQVASLLRRIKVIMVPLLGLISCKSFISVRSSCLNTWHYFLHKLNHLINHPSVLATSFTPILEVVFLRGPEDHNICLWNSCLDLLDEFVLSKVKIGDIGWISDSTCNVADKLLMSESHIDSKNSQEHYPIKWLPWEISNIHLHLKMINCIISQGMMMTLTHEKRTLACYSALRIFRSVLQGVQVELKMLSTHFDRIQFCIHTIFKFTRELCEKVASKQVANQWQDSVWIALQFVKAITDVIDPSILASPLYRVPLDLSYINMKSSGNNEAVKVLNLGFRSLAYMDMVLPVVYTTMLNLCMVAQSMICLSDIDGSPDSLKQSKFLLFSMSPSTNLHAVISFLYMHIGKPVDGRLYWLTIWRVIAKGLKETIDNFNKLSFLKMDHDNAGYTMIHWFLCYPLLMLFSPEKVSSPSGIDCLKLSMVSSHRQLEIELVIEVWRSVFDSSIHASQNAPSSMNSFTEGLCKILNRVLDENTTSSQSTISSCLKEKSEITIILYVVSEVVVDILRHIQAVDANSSGSTDINHESSKHVQSSPITNVLGLVERFLVLLPTFMETNLHTDDNVISRVFTAMACLIGCICLKQDILLFIQAISSPMVQLLSLFASTYVKMQQGRTICQLHFLWTQILDCLQRCQPPIAFDSLLLEVQAPLLQATLDHAYLPISDTSIAFWKATYGQKTNLNYPPCLHPILDKLSRKGRISLLKENSDILVNDGYSFKEAINAQGYAVCIKHERIIGLDYMEKLKNDIGCNDIVDMCFKRKRLKAVNDPMNSNMHRGRFEDLSGFSRGKDADFSQMFEKILDQDIRKPEYILEMLKRAR